MYAEWAEFIKPVCLVRVEGREFTPSLDDCLDYDKTSLRGLPCCAV